MNRDPAQTLADLMSDYSASINCYREQVEAGRVPHGAAEKEIAYLERLRDRAAEQLAELRRRPSPPKC